jgi:hypothetical protein
LNSLLSIYLLRNDIQQADKVVHASSVEARTNSHSHDVFSISDMASFNFLTGKIFLIYGRTDTARTRLERAFLALPQSRKRDRRLVLAYLVPLNLSLGILPSQELISAYDLAVFAPIVHAVSDGRTGDFDTAVEENRLLFVRLGVWRLLVEARKIAERRLMEMVFDAWGQTRLPLPVICAAFREVQECVEEEVEVIVCNLIYEKMMQANVAHCHRMVLFPPSERGSPFPPFSLP